MRVMTAIETAAFKMDFTLIGKVGWFNETYSNGMEQMKTLGRRRWSTKGFSYLTINKTMKTLGPGGVWTKGFSHPANNQ